MMLDEVGQYIAANISDLTAGVDFFFDGVIRDDPENATFLFQIPGPGPVRTLGGVSFVQPGLQSFVRNTDPAKAWELAEQISQLLDGKGNMQIPDITGPRYGAILARSEPHQINSNETINLINPIIVTQEFDVIKKRSAA